MQDAADAHGRHVTPLAADQHRTYARGPAPPAWRRRACCRCRNHLPFQEPTNAPSVSQRGMLPVIRRFINATRAAWLLRAQRVNAAWAGDPSRGAPTNLPVFLPQCTATIHNPRAHQVGPRAPQADGSAICCLQVPRGNAPVPSLAEQGSPSPLAASCACARPRRPSIPVGRPPLLGPDGVVPFSHPLAVKNPALGRSVSDPLFSSSANSRSLSLLLKPPAPLRLSSFALYN